MSERGVTELAGRAGRPRLVRERRVGGPKRRRDRPRRACRRARRLRAGRTGSAPARCARTAQPRLPAEALEDAFRKLTRPEGAELVARNRGFHRLLVDGVTVEYRAADGRHPRRAGRVIDFDDVEANDWLAVNQFTVIENKHNRRPDIVLFVNGLPLAVIRAEERGRRERDDLDRLPAASDLQGRDPVAVRARTRCWSSPTGWRRAVGTLTAGREWFKPWRTIAGRELADAHCRRWRW